MRILRARSRAGPLFARASPREIQILEDYSYEADLTSRPLILPQGTPSARIAVIVPYDGHAYFTEQASADVHTAVQQAIAAGRDDDLEARIGYLALAGFERTSLDEVARLGERNNILPLDVPVYGASVPDLGALTAGRRVCRLELPYRPSLPDAGLVHVAVQVSDEDTLQDERARLMNAADEVEREQRLRELARRVGEQDVFGRTVAFHFSVHLSLGPRYSGPPPTITRVALQWPVATSYRNLRLVLAPDPGVRRPHPFYYERETNMVTWGGIPLTSFSEQNDGKERSLYRAPDMFLHVEEPDELHGQRYLEGELHLNVPVPLSGGNARFFNALGQAEAVAVKRRSRIKLSFGLDVLNCFQGRLFSPYQHFQFPGVILNEMRLADVKTLLQAERFVLTDELCPRSEAGEEDLEYLLAFYRPEGAGKLRLWVRLEGRPASTTREREIPDGERFTTRRHSGDMMVYLRAELAGDSERPVAVMNRLHRLLKERFRYVKVPK